MRESRAAAFARYQDEVRELMRTGEPFGAVEDVIDGAAELTEDARDALWLLAFSLRASGDRRRPDRAHLAAQS